MVATHLGRAGVQQEDPAKAERIREQNRLIAHAKNSLHYVNERFLRMYVEQIPDNVLREMIDESRNWTQLKNYILDYAN